MTKKIEIPVIFTGTVTVSVPTRLTDNDAQALAAKMALSQVMAVANNDDFFLAENCINEFIEESGLPDDIAGDAWEDSEIVGINGVWRAEEAK